LKPFRSEEVTPTPAEHLESIPGTTAAERAVADLMPVDVSREEARAVLERVPLWFHTFSLRSCLRTRVGFGCGGADVVADQGRAGQWARRGA
jgi:hypothetical protein